MLRTADGGATIQTLGFSRRGLDAVAFAGPARVLAVGERGTILRSDDSGGTFGPVSGEIGVSFRFGLRLGPVPGSVFALGREGTIARSTDGGNRWRALSTGSRSAIVDAKLSTLERGHAVNWTGRVFRTTDGGANWTPVDTRRARAVLEVRGRTLLATREGIEHFDRADRAIFAYGPDRVLHRPTRAGRGARCAARGVSRTSRCSRPPAATRSTRWDGSGNGARPLDGARRGGHRRGTVARVRRPAIRLPRVGRLRLADEPGPALHAPHGRRRPELASAVGGPRLLRGDDSVVAESAHRAYAVSSAGRGLGGYRGLLNTPRGGDTGTPTTLTLTRVRSAAGGSRSPAG